MIKIGAETKQPFSLANTASAVSDHLNVVLEEVKAVRGAASWLKLRIKHQ